MWNTSRIGFGIRLRNGGCQKHFVPIENNKYYFAYMKRIALLLLASSFLCSTRAQTNDEAFHLRAAHIYSDQLSLLEYRGAVSGIRFDLPLPDGTQENDIVVRTRSADRLLSYTVQDQLVDVKKPIRSLIEMLKENVGYAVTIEVFEGRESIAYSGEIQAIDDQSSVVFLRTSSTLEMIPLANIQHLSGGRGLNITSRKQASTRVLSVFFVGDVKDEVITVLLPNRSLSARARYLLDFDKPKTELSLDLQLTSAISFQDISIYFYGVPFEQSEAGKYNSQAAFQLTGIGLSANQQTSYQVLTHAVEMALSDVAEVQAWEPGNSSLTQTARGKRTLSIQNGSSMNWFRAPLFERKSKSLGHVPGEMPATLKGAEARLEYGKSPFVINDNARLVKVSKKAITISGMKYDSFLFEGKIDIRNTGNEPGRVKIIKQAVPENKRNYWFANVFIDLKGKNKQEVNQLEYEVKVEANDATFYRYRYELLVPSEN